MLLGWRVSGCRVGELPEITAMALLIALYGCVIFLSAFLLFLVQPMAAKQLLPVLGGSAAVWTTCLVFFQTALLAGYFYAWRIVARLRPLAQSLVHIALLTAALLVLGTRIRADAFPAAQHPVWSILLMLTATIGVPYFALSATTPLLQAWLSRTFLALGRPDAHPSYCVFALSNAGSLLALLAYPTLVEPHLSLHTQTGLWSRSFFVFAVLCGAIAWQVRRSPLIAVSEPPKPSPGMLSHKALSPFDATLQGQDAQLVIFHPQHHFIANLDPHRFTERNRDHDSSVFIDASPSFLFECHLVATMTIIYHEDITSTNDIFAGHTQVCRPYDRRKKLRVSRACIRPARDEFRGLLRLEQRNL